MKLQQKTTRPKLKIIPLGGLGEIGKNMMVIEYGDDIVVVDCGSIFPQADMLGIDLVIPDISYLVKNHKKVRGFLFTHGHEDHIGSTPYVLNQFKVPVYGTRLTLALMENKCKEHKIENIDMRCIKAGDRITVGCFAVEFIKVSHSIAGSVALAIHTPAGIIVHTGDFKVDFTPVDGEIADLGKLAGLGRQGVLALLADSTNVERPGYTMSERTVGETFERFFRTATGRIVIATFSSNIHRIQQVVDAAKKFNRKICLSGRSMLNVGNVAMELGELQIPENMLLSIEEVNKYNDDEIVIITTGSQGEPMSGLVRMASSEHKIDIHSGDMVIISASPIPGNEKFVSRVINQLYRKGAQVIYEALDDVHVSGHACREELKLIHTLVKPKYFIPAHGEYRHLKQHALLAESLGMDSSNIFILDIGQVLEFSRNSARISGAVPSGMIMIDGSGIGDIGSMVLRERKLLSDDGLVAYTIAISKSNGQLLSQPEIISKGFVYVPDAEELMEEAGVLIHNLSKNFALKPHSEWGNLKNSIKNSLRQFLYEKTKRNPILMPIVLEINETQPYKSQHEHKRKEG